MTAQTGYPNLPYSGGSPREVATIVNLLMAGKINCLISTFTLTSGAGSSTISDPRLSGASFIGFMPTTANAAAELGAGTLYVSARGDGTATVTHANNGQTDRTFVLLIVG